MSTETAAGADLSAVASAKVEAPADKTSGSVASGAQTPDLQADAMKVINEALATAQTPCITSSFQAECVVLTHMLLQVRPDIPVLFLDTLHHFPQTLAYRDELTQKWGLKLTNLRAKSPDVGLWQRESTTACCARHKVEPLFSALEDYDTWFTALRRDQSPSRANLQENEPFRLPSGKSIRRVAPIAAWTARDVWRYAKANGIPLLPLYELGYTSIGCEPCTALPPDPNNPRSGRWQGEKLECGIHIQAK
jgi:phosphoadenosine phosphosulfate reductase